MLNLHPSNLLPATASGVVFLLMALVLAPTAVATVFLPISDAELVDRSPLIIEARILAVEPGPGPLPTTDVLVEATAWLKGRLPGDLLVVRLPGGVRTDGVGLRLWGTPRFRAGDEALLFLRPRSDGAFAIQELLLGAFQLSDDGESRIATRDLSEAHRMTRPGGVEPASGPRDAEAFLRWIDDRIQSRERAPDYFLETSATDFDTLAPTKFRTIVSTFDPPPLGCGENGGHAARWFEFDTGDSVGWRGYFTGQEGLVDGGFPLLQQVLEVWNDPNTSVDFEFLGLTSSAAGLGEGDGVNSVLFGDPADQIPGRFEGDGLLALSGPRFDCRLFEFEGELFHPLFEADIVTQDGLEQFFASVPNSNRAAEQIFGHELGHSLGLAHSEVPEALMAADYHPDLRGAALHLDDLVGLHALYGSPDLLPPAPPMELAASLTFPNWVRLTWSDASNNESVFRIERRASGDYELVTTVAANTTAYVDSTVLPDTLYSYRVRSQNGIGASAFSPPAEILTDADQRPKAPTNLRVAPLSSSVVRLGWQDNSDNESGFVIDIRIGSTWFEIPTRLLLDTVKVIVSGLPADSTFGFRLRAFNQFGESANSNTVDIETFAADSACEVTDEQLCLLDGRFRVTVRYRNQHDEGAEGEAVALPETNESGLFWFFSPENIELIVKILDGTRMNQHFWVFYGALSDIEYWVTVEDTQTGASQTYYNPPGEICGVADTLAFPEGMAPSGEATNAPETSPAARRIAERRTGTFSVESLDVSELVTETAATKTHPREVGTCEVGPENLCLLDHRLNVEVRWRNPRDGSQGTGRSVIDSDSTGFFWFFNLENTELVVKALDGTGLNHHLWLFYGALTDLEYWITVTDTVTGTSRVYYNPPGEVCGRADIEAFVIETLEEPPGAEPVIAPDPTD